MLICSLVCIYLLDINSESNCEVQLLSVPLRFLCVPLLVCFTLTDWY